MAKQTDKEKKEKDIQETIDEIKQRFGEGSIVTLKGLRSVDVGAISTGSFSLDLALGIMGVPRGRIIEIFGTESSGKTTLALHIAAEAQKQKGKVAFIDAEHALDPDYAQRVGVKVNDILISQPDSGEQALQIVESLVRSEGIDVIVIDSVAALTPKAEIAGEIGDVHIGLQARLMSQAMRKLSAVVGKSNTVVIFLNQTRMRIGITFGNPQTTPGGLALKFYASVRIELKRIAQIKKGEEIVGSRVRAKVVKNKVAAPFKIAEFDIYYNEGISYFSDLITVGLKHDVIQKSGSWYQYDKIKLGQGVDGSRNFLKENKDIAKQIKKQILEKVNQ